MNKKVKLIIGTVALGSVLLGATAYGAISGTSGYDLYKEALKNTIAFKSISPNVEVTVKDNGNQLVKVDAASKINKTTKTMSNNITIEAGDKTENVAMYQQDGKMITKTSDSKVYNVVLGRKFDKRFGPNAKFKMKERQAMDPSREKDIENVVDALFSNVQNYITLSDNSDGTKDVALNMSETQVAPVINAVTSLFVKNATRPETGDRPMGMEQGKYAFMAQLKDKLPKLVDNIRVKSVDLDAKISTDNLIQGQTENFVITGTDASGNNHEVAISITSNFTDFNSTTPDKIDLKGKKVKEVQPQMYGDMKMQTQMNGSMGMKSQLTGTMGMQRRR